MDRLILHASSTAQWQALVKDAAGASEIKLTENLESYLVFLLMRFMGSPEIVQTILANEMLAGLSQLGTQRLQTLRDIGDKCLLFSGLFPGRARRRRVRISYFVKMGQNAYSTLSAQKHKETAHLFDALSRQFVDLMDVLQTMREIEEAGRSLDLLQAEELWTDTHSLHALKSLRRITQSQFLYTTSFPFNRPH
jgi:hypothetical protein